MKAALLAAGKGKRLRPATEARPKPLLPIAGSTLFHFNFELVREFPEVYAVVSYRKDLFLQLSGELGFKVVDQGEPLGTGHAVSVLGTVVQDDLVLIYSDIYLPPDSVENLMAVSDRYDHVVAVARVEKPWEFGVVKTSGDLLVGIVEKPPKGKEPSNFVVAGAFVLGQSIFDYVSKLRPSRRGELELTDALTMAARSGEKVGVMEVSPWLDAGRPSDFLEAQRLLVDDVLDHRRAVPEGFLLEGDKIVSPEAELDEAKLEGPVVIGRCLVENSTVSEYSYLEEGCKVEGSRVSNSVVMSGTLVKESGVSSSIVTDESILINSELVSCVTAPTTVLVRCRLIEEAIWEDRKCVTWLPRS